MILFGLLMGLALADDGPGPVVERFAEWTTTPVVVVCPDFPGSVEDVKDAVREVEAHGGKLGEVRRGDCSMMPVEEIQIHSPLIDMPPNMIGLTIPVMEDQPSGLPVMHGAVIMMRPGWTRSTAMRHELLHALGLAHATKQGHVMTDDMARAGEDWTGVKGALRD